MSKDLMDKIDAILTEGVKKTKKRIVKEDEDEIVNDVPADDTEVDFGGEEDGLEDEEPTWAEKVAAFESQLDDEQKEGVLNYIQNVIEAAQEEEGSEGGDDLDSGDEEIEVAPEETY